MAFCKNCGQQLADGTKFCTNCGTALESAGAENGGATTARKIEGEKCPNCGAALKAFDAVCPYCGSELRARGVSSAIKEFSEKLCAIGDSGDVGMKVSLIKTFVVPNTIEDLTEFFILASDCIDEKTAFKSSSGDDEEDKNFKNDKKIAKAWISKFEQVYKKAKLSFGSSPQFQTIENLYQEKEKSIKKAKILALLPVCLPFVLIVVIFGGIGIGVVVNNKKESKEEIRLEAIYKEVGLCIEKGDYDKAVLQANNLVWSLSSENSKSKKWEKLRTGLLEVIETNRNE